MKKQIKLLIMLFILGNIIFNLTVTAYAISNKNKDVDLIILFNENIIDSNVEDLITKSNGKIIREIKELGGIEVKCNSEIIPKIKAENSVKSVSPNNVINLRKNKTIKLDDKENIYYDDKGNSYYDDKENSYYDDKGNSYYDDKGNSYYEDKGNSYYQNNNISADLYEKYQWDIKKVTNNGESLKIESGNHNIIVGIIDSGVDKEHPDLKNNFLGGKNYVPKGFQGNKDETGEIDDISDKFVHGTCVAGEIAANGRTMGVAPNIGFKVYRVIDSKGQSNAEICSEAIIDAVNDGVNVINLSLEMYALKGQCYWTDENTGIKYDLGDSLADIDLLERAIKYAIENNVIVVAAAGNEALDCTNNNYLTNHLNDLYGEYGYEYIGLTYEEPGSIEGVITVSATNSNDFIASYSNYGQGFINITAPGGDVNEGLGIQGLCFTTSVNGGYEFNEGTSFAAPKVSAVAALILCQNKELTYKEVLDKIYSNAKKLHNKMYYGNGMVNVLSCVKK